MAGASGTIWWAEAIASRQSPQPPQVSQSPRTASGCINMLYSSATHRQMVKNVVWDSLVHSAVAVESAPPFSPFSRSATLRLAAKFSTLLASFHAGLLDTRPAFVAYTAAWLRKLRKVTSRHLEAWHFPSEIRNASQWRSQAGAHWGMCPSN